ncbi:MAG: hypothetical protein PHQ28_00245 [Mycobacterium sp.]|nr:hypothetical protein [Mycobacterium sp.]
MRIYAVRDASQSISTISYKPSVSAEAAEALRLSRIQAEVVYTESAAGSVPTPAEWASAEAYQLGRSTGFNAANFGQAYEGATGDTVFDCTVPGHFSGADADDYRLGHTDGVASFWALDE